MKATCSGPAMFDKYLQAMLWQSRNYQLTFQYFQLFVQYMYILFKEFPQEFKLLAKRGHLQEVGSYHCH